MRNTLLPYEKFIVFFIIPCFLLFIGTFAVADTHCKLNGKSSHKVSSKEQVNRLNQLASTLNQKYEPKTAIKYAQKALSISIQKKFNKPQLDALLNITKSYILLREYQLAKKYGKKALGLARKHANKPAIGESKLFLGIAHYYLRNYMLALTELTDSLHYITFNQRDIWFYIQYGDIALQSRQYNFALKHYKIGLKIAKKNHFIYEEIQLLTDIGHVYGKQRNIKKALKYQEEALSLIRKNSWHNSLLVDVLTKVGTTYWEAEKFRKALGYFKETLSLSRKINYTFSICPILIRIGKCYVQLHSYNKTLKIVDECRRINKHLKDKKTEQEIYHILAEMYYLKRDYKNALTNYKAYFHLKAITSVEEFKNSIAVLEAKNESIKNTVLTNKLKLQNQVIKKNRTIVIFLIPIIFLALSLSIVLMALRRNREKHIADLNNINNKLEELERKRTNKLRELIAKLEVEIKERIKLQHLVKEISDKERERIANDIHDNLGQIFVGISFKAKSLLKRIMKHQFSKNVEAEAKDLVTTITLGMKEVSQTAKLLSNIECKNHDIIDLLQKLCSYTAKNHNINCSFYAINNYNGADLEHEKLVHLYRIAQEAVNNSLKHGKAKNIKIFIKDGKLAICDDGIGFDNSEEQEGIGLKIMRYRSEYINGKLSIKSRKHRTIVICYFPDSKWEKNSKTTFSYHFIK